MTDDIHSCSYYCDRPECIKTQRDELVRNYIEQQAEWPSDAVRVLLECLEDDHGGNHTEADCRHCKAFNELTATLTEKGNH